MEHLTYEELSEILARINSWIDNCDSKVSVLLSGIGIFTGIFLTSDYIDNIIKISQLALKTDHVILTIIAVIYVSVSIGSLIVLLCGCWYLFQAIAASVNSNEFKKRGAYSSSLIFFSSIAERATLAEYRDKLEKCSKEQIKLDIISQIYICSIICDRKFSLYNKGLYYIKCVLIIKIIEMYIGPIFSTQSSA